MSLLARVLPAAGALVGVVHLLAPERLLAAAGLAYDRVLAVEFEPRANATRRVRAVGAAFLVASLLAVRSGGR